MGDSNTNQSTGNVEAVTALTNAATIRKLLRLPNEEGKTNFEILEVRSISDLANGHNCEVTIRVDLAFGHEGLPVPENERYSVRTETVRRIDLKDVAKLAGLELNDKQQYVGSVTDVESVAALLKAKLTEDDITIAQIKDVMWVRTKPESVGFVGMLTFAEGGEPGEKLPTSITATLSANEVNVGSKITGTVEVLPADAANKSFTAVTSDPTIATINEDGTEITGVKAGTVKITYSTVAAPTVKVEKTINVKMLPVVKPTGIQVTNVPTEMVEGDVVNNVTIAITPSNATDKTFTATTNDPYNLTVSPDGKTITAVGFGNGEVTYTANGDASVKQTFPISVKSPPPPPPGSITVDGVPTNMEVGGTAEAWVSIFPLNAEQAWTCTSDNQAVVTVEAVETRVVITAVGNGSAKITVVADNDSSVKFEATIQVAIKATAINVTGVPANPAVGDVINYEVEITPAGVSQEYNAVGDASAVTIDKVAKTITVLKAGLTNIYFGSIDTPEVQTTVTLTAVAGPVRPTSISAYTDSPDFAVGDQVQYSVDVLPVEAEDKTYTITSTNEAVLKVNANGTVTALAVGTAGIKHTSNANPSVESNVLEITVHPAVTSLTFTNPSEVQENSGEINLGLTVDRTPSTATVGDVVYTVVETSSGVDAEITAGSTLTAIGVVVGSTIKVRATVSRWTGEGFNTVTADQVITITGSM